MVAYADFASLNPEVVIFDMDGTLLDSAPLVIECFRTMMRDLWGASREAAVTDAQLLTYLGPPLWDSMQDLYPQGTQADWEEMVARFRELCVPRAEESELFAGIPEVLEALHQRGYRLAVATTKLEDVACRILEHYGAADFFETVGGTQPDLGIFTKTAVLRDVLQRLGLTNEPSCAVMIGDRRFDIEGATECGVPAVLVTWAKTALPGEETGATAVVGTTEELLELFPARHQD